MSSKERDINDIFGPTSFAAGYAWNSAPIDSTYILRSIPAIGRKRHFTIDINLNAVPRLTQNNNHATLEYLKLTGSSRHFYSSILKILIEDRRTAHIERINNSRNLVVL